MKRKNENGFTLVELIVTVLLASILVGGVYAFFLVYTGEKVETAAYLKAQIQSEAVIDAIGRYTREANCLSYEIRTQNNVTKNECGDLHYYTDAFKNVTEFSGDTVFFHLLGETMPFAGFGVANGKYLMEYNKNSTPKWKPFKTGVGDTVYLEYNGNGSGNVFTLPKGKLLTILECNMLIKIKNNIKAINDGKDFDLKMEKEIFQCRR
jgi:prepilin-type N-terminal cleavage/methylation domain-containing protein